MTCDQRQDLLLLYAAGLLEPDERDALREHLATGCPLCAGALAEAEAALAQMALATPPVAPPAGTLDRLMSRIATTKPSAATMKPASSNQTLTATSRLAASKSSGWMRLMPALLAAAAAAMIVSGVAFYLTRDARSFWRSTNLETIALKSTTQPNARGQVWWDRDRQQWRVSVNDLGPAPSGRAYELWFIPAGGAPMRSELFTPNAEGEATVIVKVPSNVGALATAAITDEPFGGSDAPTGQIHLAGQFH